MSATWPSGSEHRFYDGHDRKVDGSTPIQASNKDEGAYEINFTVFFKNVLITYQTKLRQKGGGNATVPPPPGYSTGDTDTAYYFCALLLC